MSGVQPSRHRHAVARVAMLLASSNDAPVAAQLHYSTRDPYAVRATFRREGHPAVEWTFARDLLLVGVARHAGIGDVQIHPIDGAVALVLSSPEGSATLTAAASDLRRFGARTLRMVPTGRESEFIDLDEELAILSPAISAGGES